MISISSVTRKNLPIGFTNLSYWVGVYIFLPVIPVFYSQNGFDAEIVGYFVGAFSIGAILTRFLVGFIADRVGFNKIAILGIIASMLAILGFFIANNSATVIISLRIIHGIGSAMYSAVALALVTLYNEETDIKEAVGFYTLCSMVGIGIITSSALFVYSHTSFNIVLIIAFIMTMFALLSFLKVPIVKISTHSKNKHKLSNVIFNKQVILPSGAQFLVYVCYSLIITFLPLIAIKYYFVNSLWLFYVFYSISVVVSRIGVKYINKYISLQKASKIILALVILSFAMMYIIVLNTLILIVLGLFLGIAVGVATPVFASMVTMNTPKETRGTIMGFFSSSIDIGMVVGSILVGILSAHFPYSSIIVVMSFITLIYYALYIKIYKEA